MGSSGRISAVVRRSLSWTSQLMAISAAVLLGKAHDMQGRQAMLHDQNTIENETIDNTVGYVIIGDFDTNDCPGGPNCDPELE